MKAKRPVDERSHVNLSGVTGILYVRSECGSSYGWGSWCLITATDAAHRPGGHRGRFGLFQRRAVFTQVVGSWLIGDQAPLGAISYD